MEFTIYGKQHSETLLLIHGALVTQTMWKNQVAFLENQFKVITCNLPEHGGSSPLEGRYTVESTADELHRVIGTVATDRLHLCGHSLGGMVAQYLAYKYPEVVKRLILVETAYSTKGNLVEKVGASLSEFALRLMTKRQIIALTARNYGKMREATGSYITHEMSQYPKTTVLRVMSAALNYDGKQYLRQIVVPTLLVVGAENKATHRQAREMNQLIPNAELVFINQASHLANLDNPNEFNHHLKRFISESHAHH